MHAPGRIGAAAAAGADARPVAVPKFRQAFHRGQGVLGGFPHALQKEGQPGFPISGVAHAVQHMVIDGPAAQEVKAQGQGGIAQVVVARQDEHYEQPADAPVAVEKGVDGFKLQVGQAGAQEGRQAVGGRVGVHKKRQGPHTGRDITGERRHKFGIAGVGAADPVLGVAEMPRMHGGAALAGQQDGVERAEQGVGNGGAVGNPFQAVFQRLDVVGNLPHVVDGDARGFAGLKGQQVGQG